MVIDPYVGKLTYFRVYSGTLKAGSYVLNATQDKRERIGRILQMHANHREDRDEIYAGEHRRDRGAQGSPPPARRSATIGNPIILESIEFPEPVIFVAVEPKTKADQDKLADALHQAGRRRPHLPRPYDEETGQTVISGMGELHLDIIVDRLKREFHVRRNVGRAAGGLPRDHHAPVRSRRALRAPVRWPRPVRPRGHEMEPNVPGRRLCVRETRSWAVRPA